MAATSSPPGWWCCRSGCSGSRRGSPPGCCRCCACWCCSGLVVFFMTHLWVHVAYVDEGFQGAVQFLVSNAISEIDGLLVPLVYVSAVLVIDFSFDMAVRCLPHGPRHPAPPAPLGAGRPAGGEALVHPVRRARRVGDVRPRTGRSPWSAPSCPSCCSRCWCAGSAGWRRSDDVDGAKERLLYGTSVVAGAPDRPRRHGRGRRGLHADPDQEPRGAGVRRGLPAPAPSTTTASPLLAGLAVLLGLWLGAARPRRRMDARVRAPGWWSSALWCLPALLLNLTSWEVGWSDELRRPDDHASASSPSLPCAAGTGSTYAWP